MEMTGDNNDTLYSHFPKDFPCPKQVYNPPTASLILGVSFLNTLYSHFPKEFPCRKQVCNPPTASLILGISSLILISYSRRQIPICVLIRAALHDDIVRCKALKPDRRFLPRRPWAGHCSSLWLSSFICTMWIPYVLLCIMDIFFANILREK